MLAATAVPGNSIAAPRGTCAVSPAAYQPDLARCLRRAQEGKIASIVLAHGSYQGMLDASNVRLSSGVTIEGSRAVDLEAGIDMSGSSHLVLQGVSIAPPAGGSAVVLWTGGADHLTLDRVLVDGSKTLGGGARIVTSRTATDLLVRDSEFRQCGHGVPCVHLGPANFQIVHNVFDPCEQCNFLKGRAAGSAGVTVRRNTFGSVYKQAGCSETACTHLDSIHMEGGGPWYITQNRFADCGHAPHLAGRQGDCTANVFVGNLGGDPIHDVYIANNVFRGRTNRGVLLGDYSPLIGRIAVVNNTFANSGGSPSIVVMRRWQAAGGGPQPNAPIVANNIEYRGSRTVCTRARHYSNLVVAGAACRADPHGSADLRGKAFLNASLAPTPKSKKVLGRADPAYAPHIDLLGHPRGRRADIGAIQFVGRT